MKSNEFIYFEESELFPRIFDHAGELVPELNLERTRDGWRSGLRLDGTPGGRRDRLVMRKKNPFTIFENGTGERFDIIEDFERKHRLRSRYEAEIELAKYFGIEDKIPFSGEKERAEYERRREENNKRLSLNDKLVNALFSPEGKSGLEYLREKRGYSDEIIREAGLGFVTPSLNEELGETYKYNIGKISIPFRLNGRIIGYKYRNISPDCEKGDRYRATDNKTNTKGYYYPSADYLFNLGTVRLDKEDKGIIIVEGEFDCISGELIGGLSNICAIGTNNLGENHVKQLQNIGVERVYLFLDMDRAGRKGTENSIEKLISIGIEVYIGEIPDGKDPDEFFRNGGTGEEFQNLAKKGIHFSEFKFRRYFEEWKKSFNEGDESRSFDVFKKKVIELSKGLDPIRKRLIFHLFSEATGLIITPEDIERATRDKEREIELATQQAQQREKIEKTTGEVTDLLAKGKQEEALSALVEGAEEARSINTEEKYSRFLNVRTAQEREESYKKHPGGFPTRFYFGKGEDRFRAEIPTDALTIIGGKTSHGKSRFLINLALDFASYLRNMKDTGRVLYFCFEENSDKVELKMLNTFLGIKLNKGGRNLSAIMNYYKEGGNNWIMQGERGRFKAVSDFFFREYIDNGRIQVINDSRDIPAIIGTIDYLNSHIEGGIKAVFIDYIQLLTDEKSRGERYQILKGISEKLNTFANKNRIPIILGAQVKREVRSPLDFEAEAISDASDIEKSADNIWLIWDSKQDVSIQDRDLWHAPQGNGLNKMHEHPTELALYEPKFIPGQDGSLYVKIVKNRNASRGDWEVLEIENFSGRIKSSIKNEEGKLIDIDIFGRKEVPETGEQTSIEYPQGETVPTDGDSIRQLTQIFSEPEFNGIDPETDDLPF